MLPPRDFKSLASAYSATPAQLLDYNLYCTECQVFLLKKHNFLFVLHPQKYCATMILRGERIMKYRLNTTLTEDNYLDYIQFCGNFNKKNKRRILIARVLICIEVLVACVVLFKIKGITPINIITVMGWFGIVAFFQVFLKKYFRLCKKIRIKFRKKKGKCPYSSWSVTEFYDDFFRDTTETKQYEVQYTSLTSITVIKDKLILLNDDKGINFIIPINCLGTQEQYDAFISFIKTKCPKIDFYDKI
jgi:hypothetical protein